MNNIITIVTPSLNQGQFLEQTTKSVLSQEGDFFIDYIIVDGGSADNSVKIIKKYDKLLKTKQYPIECKGIEYRWWSKPDKGQSNAINRGFKIAKGDILAWINSDDYYEPGAFKFVMEKFRKNPDIDLIYGDGYIIKEKTKEKTILKVKPGNFEIFLKRGSSICQPSAFFTKRIMNKIGLLDENLHYVMDYDLWLRVLKNGKSLHFPRVLSNFRIWESSKTNVYKKKFLSERKKIFKKYKGPKIDPKTIYKIRNKIPFSNYLRIKFPKFYKCCKKIFYFFIDKFHFKS